MAGAGRPLIQAQPRELTEEELAEIVELFETGRAAFVPYSTKVGLRVHSIKKDWLESLEDAHGGNVRPYAGTYRWLLMGDALIVLLDRIEPLLTLEKAKATLGLARQLLGTSPRQSIEDAHEQQAKLLQERIASQKVREAAPISPNEDSAAIDIDADIPPGHIDEDEPILDLVGIETKTFRAQDPAQAENFVRVAKAAGFEAFAEGRFVRISRGGA